ncbi:17364_t:CDS:2, partial [Acaulospora morrowiae]
MSYGIEAESGVFSSERDKLDTSDHEDTIDDQEMRNVTNNKKGPSRMCAQNQIEFAKSYKAMEKVICGNFHQGE